MGVRPVQTSSQLFHMDFDQFRPSHISEQAETNAFPQIFESGWRIHILLQLAIAILEPVYNTSLWDE
jgi:hypothetical protein